MKRLISLTFCLMTTLLSFAHDFELNGIYYNFVVTATSVEAEVTYKGEAANTYNNEYTGDVTIPPTIHANGKFLDVTRIAGAAFYNCSGLTSITIPNSVTTIGEVAFSYCTNLTSITIPNSVTRISNNMFYGCSGLKSVTIPSSVTKIGTWAFKDCSSLSSITIPSSVTSIGEKAFQGCDNLINVIVENKQPLSITSDVFSNRTNATLHVPAGSKSAYQSANYWKEFKGIVEGFDVDGIYYKFNSSPAQTVSVTFKGDSYSSYTNEYTGAVKIPLSVSYGGKTYSVTGIGNNAFYACKSLTSVTIPNSVTSIGTWAFYYCTGLTSVTIPNSVTSIGEYAFGNSGLTSVTIPGSVTSISNCTFYNCSSLTSVTIPKSVTSIGSSAFDGCSSLTSVYVGMETPISIGSGVFSNRANATLYVPSGCKSAYKAANYWKEFKGIVDSFDFYGLYFRITSKTDMTVELTYRGADAFSYENEYTGAVNIPSSVTYGGKLYTVTSIGEYAFYGCTGLTSVTCPSSVKSIGNWAFYNCTGLTSFTIANSVTSIGEYAFGKCSGLTSVTIPTSVTSISNCTFYGCSGLTSVTIPNSVTSIGNSAFKNCSGLTSITIPESVTSIGSSAFYNCSGLTSVTIPNSVTSIGSSAFYGCSGLTSVTVGWEKPVSISSTVFSNRANATLHVPFGSKSAYANANYWKEFKEIVEEETCWQGSFLLKFNESPAQTVTVIYHDMSFLPFDVFAGKVTIPSSTTHNGKTYIVTSIDESAFHDYDKMTSVSIPSSVTSIGSGAFRGCSSLTSVTVGWDTPISIGYGVFPNMKNATLHVPAGCKSAYEAADVWKEFKEIIEEYVVGDVSGDNVVDILDYTGVGNYIHGNAPEGFNEQAADVDKNGIIDILDYTGIANIIHTGNIFGN